jgi:hypothetical protein
VQILLSICFFIAIRNLTTSIVIRLLLLPLVVFFLDEQLLIPVGFIIHSGGHCCFRLKGRKRINGKDR